MYVCLLDAEELMRLQQRMTAAQYRNLLGMSKGVIVPAKSTVRKSIVEMNKVEAAYAHYLEFERLAGRIVAWWPQPFALKLPGWRQTYRPDFLICTGYTGSAGAAILEVVEIKVRWRNGKVGWQPDAREKFKCAAGIYTCFAWVAKWKDEFGIWQEERFDGG